MTDTAKPLMLQYNSAKQQVGNALLLFRVGDFYELFYDDAVTAVLTVWLEKPANQPLASW